jgi:hypothetical protein
MKDGDELVDLSAVRKIAVVSVRLGYALRIFRSFAVE